MTTGGWIAAAVAAGALLASACESDHSRLAKTASASVGAGGGSGGDGAGGGVTGGGGDASSGGEGGVVEPPGPTRLTVVNGVVDESAVRFCFLAYPEPSGGELPWPSAEGLPFARAAKVDIEASLPDAGDVEVRLVAGPTGSIGGKSCLELSEAQPSGVRVLSLGVLPEAALDEPKSLLLATYGCIGGPERTDPLEKEVCGEGYAPDSPTVALAAGFLSRLTTPSSVAMQFVHAVRGMGQVSLRLLPGVDGSVGKIVVQQWSLGAIAPFPPSTPYAASELGTVASAALRVEQLGSASEVTFAAALANGSLTAKDVVDGQALAFVAVGAPPNLPEGAWWQPFTYTAVKPDS